MEKREEYDDLDDEKLKVETAAAIELLGKTGATADDHSQTCVSAFNNKFSSTGAVGIAKLKPTSPTSACI